MTDGEADLEDASRLVGVPDEFQRLWTPHRMAYIQAGPEPLREECPFCEAPKYPDAERLIVARGETAYVLLNLFPYNSGHLLVCPYRHIATYDQATAEEVAEIGALTQTAMRVLREVSGCDGFNLGMNQERWPERAWTRICTSTWCRGGARTRTSSRSSPRRRRSRSSSARCGRPSPRRGPRRPLSRRVGVPVPGTQRTWRAVNCIRGFA